MKLASYQQFLARVYTQQDFRNEFFKHPVYTGNKHGIEAEIALQLAEECKRQIQFFSQALLNKRYGALKHFYPLLLEVWEKPFQQYFYEYAAQNILKDQDRYAEDALEYGSFLLKIKKKEIDQSGILFLYDLIDFSRLQIRSDKNYLRIKKIKYDWKSYVSDPARPRVAKKRSGWYVHFRCWRVIRVFIF